MVPPFRLYELAPRHAVDAHSDTVKGAHASHPPGRQLDGPKVRARGTKALPGKGIDGILFPVSDTFFEALPFAHGGAFLLRHGLPRQRSAAQ